MAEKRNKRNTRNNQQKKTLPWGLMFLSFVVGAFVMFLVHLDKNVEPEKQINKAKKNKVEKKAEVVEPTFEFYSLLPEMEVMVDTPDSTKKAIVTSPAQKTDKTVKNSSNSAQYLLQVGSFRKSSDAEAHKAKLAFLGIVSKVQTVTIDNKATWHRVQVGPIIGRAKADELKKQLKQNNIDSLLVRSKRG